MTTELKVTPGEWTVKNFNADDLDSPVRFTGPCVVYSDEDCEHHPIADCSCNHTCRDDEETWANAHLMAASKKLYEALEEVLDYRGGAEHALADAYVVERIKDALAAARGETP